jgi:hypothetical protein
MRHSAKRDLLAAHSGAAPERRMGRAANVRSMYGQLIETRLAGDNR